MMSEQEPLYNEEALKKEMVGRLEKLYEQTLHDGEYLDQKAWNILSVTSAIFGLAAPVQIALSDNVIGPEFYIGLGVALIAYIVLLFFIAMIIKPTKYTVVPEYSKGDDAIYNRYMSPGGWSMYEVLIIDYAGDGEDPGGIASVSKENERKAKWLRLSMWAMGAVVVSLIAMALLPIVLA